MKTVFYALFSLISLTSCEADGEDLNIAVASNFNLPMRELVAEFEKITQHNVRLSFGSSGKIFAQIQHGAPFHLFFSADQDKPIALERDDKIVPGSRFTYAIGSLVLWSSKKNFLDNPIERLRSESFNKLALANPKLAPYGKAALQVMENLEINQITKPKWVLGENIAQTFQFVATGNAELGFIATSQLENKNTGSIWFIPFEFYQPILQDAVILKQGEKIRATLEFVNFVKQTSGQQIIQSYGYTTPE